MSVDVPLPTRVYHLLAFLFRGYQLPDYGLLGLSIAFSRSPFHKILGLESDNPPPSCLHQWAHTHTLTYVHWPCATRPTITSQHRTRYPKVAELTFLP